MSNNNIDIKDKLLNKLYSGGMQQYFPRNEAHVYKNNFTLDVSSYCIKDLTSNNLSQNEINCIENLVVKNKEFLNSII